MSLTFTRASPSRAQQRLVDGPSGPGKGNTKEVTKVTQVTQAQWRSLEGSGIFETFQVLSSLFTSFCVSVRLL